MFSKPTITTRNPLCIAIDSKIKLSMRIIGHNLM